MAIFGEMWGFLLFRIWFFRFSDLGFTVCLVFLVFLVFVILAIWFIFVFLRYSFWFWFWLFFCFLI